MFNQLSKNLQKYFGISRSEANGMVVVMLLMILLLITPLLYRNYATRGYQNYEKDKALLDSLVAIYWPAAEDHAEEDVSNDPVPVTFDPNKAGFVQMIRMGFDSILAGRVIRYRKKGGVFYRPGDLLKIYGFPEALYRRIRPDIRIVANVDTLDTRSVYPGSEKDVYGRDNDLKEDYKFQAIDLNEADTTQLIHIHGIGPVFSSRIIKYRNLLGGYVMTEQLSEVYGLTAETLLNLRECVFVDSLFMPEKIRINFSEWIDLVKHPYINSELANRILRNRSMKGPYKDARDFVERLEIPDSIQFKLLPYCEF